MVLNRSFVDLTKVNYKFNTSAVCSGSCCNQFPNAMPIYAYFRNNPRILGGEFGYRRLVWFKICYLCIVKTCI